MRLTMKIEQFYTTFHYPDLLNETSCSFYIYCSLTIRAYEIKFIDRQIVSLLLSFRYNYTIKSSLMIHYVVRGFVRSYHRTVLSEFQISKCWRLNICQLGLLPSQGDDPDWFMFKVKDCCHNGTFLCVLRPKYFLPQRQYSARQIASCQNLWLAQFFLCKIKAVDSFKFSLADSIWSPFILRDHHLFAFLLAEQYPALW